MEKGEYNQEMPQLHTAYQHFALHQEVDLSKAANSLSLSSSARWLQQYKGHCTTKHGQNTNNQITIGQTINNTFVKTFFYI